MCSEDIYLAGRYNKYVRNLSQSPWLDKADSKIAESVKELIEEGLKKFLQFDKAVFSSSGREDVDVRMLGRGRPFVFKLINLWKVDDCDRKTMQDIQKFVNLKNVDKIRVTDLQVVSKKDVDANLKDGQESKTKDYRAYCCCSRPLTNDDISKLSEIVDLEISQRTPIRVLHRRSVTMRPKKIHKMNVVSDLENCEEFSTVPEVNRDRVFVLDLQTEAGTYIKEFIHGDFGRTSPNLASIIHNCRTDLFELDVMEVNLDWPPQLTETVRSVDLAKESQLVTKRDATSEVRGPESSDVDTTEESTHTVKKIKEDID